MSPRFLKSFREVVQRGATKFKALFMSPKKTPSPGVKPGAVLLEEPPIRKTQPSAGAKESSPVVVAPRRAVRLWNIGLDFGTAFTKCVVRNLASEEAFIVPL